MFEENETIAFFFKQFYRAIKNILTYMQNYPIRMVDSKNFKNKNFKKIKLQNTFTQKNT